ncbi:uncharacterized protein LOC118646710 [Monomorium pharaonis]|uniref:uncharacterized protein LOC118646710 n=1 Tax=Monomorium pharaonis TaxID=307658 RepID=UPI0017476A7D|nr:uncharacterized protein LOC118646710 [Monomorium pharaonis]
MDDADDEIIMAAADKTKIAALEKKLHKITQKLSSANVNDQDKDDSDNDVIMEPADEHTRIAALEAALNKLMEKLNEPSRLQTPPQEVQPSGSSPQQRNEQPSEPNPQPETETQSSSKKSSPQSQEPLQERDKNIPRRWEKSFRKKRRLNEWRGRGGQGGRGGRGRGLSKYFYFNIH